MVKAGKFLVCAVLAMALLTQPFFTSGTFAAGGLALKYNFGGCADEYYTPEAYYAAPVVTDINKDGQQEIVFGNYSVIVLNAATGKLVWRANGGRDITSPYKFGNDVGKLNKLCVADIDGDGYSEIVSAHANGLVSALTWDGYMKAGWPVQLKTAGGAAVTASVNALDVSDLDGDGKCEIIAGAGTVSPENVWLYTHAGKLMPGWPQLSAAQDAGKMSGLSVEGGFSYGVFMDGVVSGDIAGDGKKEIIVATDTGYICAYDIKGKLVPANTKAFNGRSWGKVALWEDYNRETTRANHNFNQGWGHTLTGGESRSELYKAELGHAVVRVADVDGDGKNEVLTSAIIVDRAADIKDGTYFATRYMTAVILNGDRTRYKGWERMPDDRGTMGAPLIQDPATLSSYVQSEPVVADLNGDGVNELIFNTYDGKVHAFSVDNAAKEYGKFPYAIPQTAGAAETANGVVCADLNGDGKQEVIFTTNTRSPAAGEPTKKGGLYVLGGDGTLAASAALPDGYRIYETQKPAFMNGSLAAPAVADVDGDGKQEIVVNTKFSGICVFDAEL